MSRELKTTNRPLSFPDSRKLEKNDSRLVTNSFADKLLVEGLQDFSVSSILAKLGRFWTRTIVAYPKSNCPFSFEIRVPNLPNNYVLDTSDYRGEKNIALMFEDFEINEDDRDRIYVPKNIIVITSFPQNNGWYKAEELGLFDIDEERFLWRTEKERVGPVARSFGDQGNSRKDVFMHHRHSEKMNFLLSENQEADSKVIPISRAVQN